MNILKYIIILLLIIIILLNLQNIEKYKEHYKNKKFYFLHVPKTGGTSIKRSFPNITNTRHSYVYLNNINKLNLKPSFAIIRNPITRLQSTFGHIKKRCDIGTSNDLNKFNSLHELATAYYNKNNKLHKDAQYLLKWDDKKLNKSVKIKNGGCPMKKKLGCIHWVPQTYLIGNLNKIKYILRFEHLENDINQLKKKNEFKNILNAKLKHSNQTPAKYKKIAQITPIVSKLINDIYKDDIKLWNYVNKIKNN